MKLNKKIILNYLVILWYFMLGFYFGISVILSNLFYIIIWLFPIITLIILLLIVFIVIENDKNEK